jgi:hypothetical protein
VSGNPQTIDATFTEAEAALKLGISQATLVRDRLAGRVFPMRYGQRIIRYTEAILAEYQESCRNAPEKSAATGSRSAPAPRNGAERGTTPALDKRDAHRLAQTIFKRRS